MQQVDGTLKTWLTCMSDSVNGPTGPKLKELFAGLPQEVLEFGELQKMAKQVAAKGRFGKNQIEAIVNTLSSVTSQLENFYMQQSGAGSAGSGGSTAAAKAKATAKAEDDEKKAAESAESAEAAAAESDSEKAAGATEGAATDAGPK
jgi:hypothetical protein